MDNKEIWADVAGANGRYQVSTFGNVLKLKSSKRSKERVVQPFIGHNGYKVIKLMYSGKRIGTGVHRVVALAFIPNPENKPHVNHKDGNKLNNHVSNLEWMTAVENKQHGVKLFNWVGPWKGKFGADNPLSFPIEQRINGRVVETYPSCMDGAEALGIKKGKLRYAIKTGRVLMGYTFNYPEHLKQEWKQNNQG